MELKGKVAMIYSYRDKVDIVDAATGEVVRQHELQGKVGEGGASVQRNIAAMAIWGPVQGFHVMDLNSGEISGKFSLIEGGNARVALSKDTLTLAVGSDTGVS
jgi:hypothetical protein